MACLHFVPSAKFGEPTLRGLKMLRSADLNGSRPDLLLAVDFSFSYFIIENALHFMVSRPSSALLSLAAILPPP